MIVHLIGSRYQVDKNINHLRILVDAIHDGAHTLAWDWVEPTFANVKRGGKNEIDWHAVYKESMEAINKADVIIADATIRGFGIGYQVAVAVQMKKPVLVLRHEEIDDSLFASGIDTGVSYKSFKSAANLKNIIKEFLEENDIKLKDMRFNFFIDRPIYNYLRWASFKTGKTKAEILRDLVSKEIEKQTLN
ncbi:MAG TPA: hypothetical protein VLA77_02345 [Candidatus Saccharimonadales bacterium]|nr:hypothetical protein [Candidatus Saccharimonadales bacterium]